MKRSTPAKYTLNPHPPSSRPNFTKRRSHRINGHQKGSLPKKQKWEREFTGTLHPSEVSLGLRDLADQHPTPSSPVNGRRDSANISASVQDVVVKPHVCCIRSFDKDFYYQKQERGTGNGERGTGIDFKATVSLKKQTCINTDKEMGEYVVHIKAYSMVITNPL